MSDPNQSMHCTLLYTFTNVHLLYIVLCVCLYKSVMWCAFIDFLENFSPYRHFAFCPLLCFLLSHNFFSISQMIKVFTLPSLWLFSPLFPAYRLLNNKQANMSLVIPHQGLKWFECLAWLYQQLMKMMKMMMMMDRAIKLYTVKSRFKEASCADVKWEIFLYSENRSNKIAWILPNVPLEYDWLPGVHDEAFYAVLLILALSSLVMKVKEA